MIRPPGFRGAAFSSADDGDLRSDPRARLRAARWLGIGRAWAEARQVHGAAVVRAERPGLLGAGDALYTRRRGLAVSVATADCLPVILEGPEGVVVIHAGWRGLVAGVVERLCETMERAGCLAERAALGPAIGPCCFEVGPEVAEQFPDRLSTTTWGTPSVDLWGAAADRLAGLDLWRADRCTHCEDGFFSHRAGGATGRQVALAWRP